MRALLRAAGLASVGLLALPAVAAAHGIAPPPPSDPIGLLGMWSFDPTVSVPIVLATVAWLSAVRSVNRAHPRNPVPRRRTVTFLVAMLMLELALQSPIEHYDTTLFSVHMVQHVLLTMIAAPLIAASGPITLLLRYSRPEVRKRWILPVLHSRALKVATNPVVAWLLFAGVMWGTHFSPLFNESLENPPVHEVEHALYLITALLFWWPVVGVDPNPWRLPHPVRAMYAFLQMPQNTFLALAIYASSTVLYQHYATQQRTWGPSPIEDQHLAGGIMWIVGDLTFFVAILFTVMQWMKHEDRETKRVDAQLDAERAEIQRREVLLADRLARERAGDHQA